MKKLAGIVLMIAVATNAGAAYKKMYKKKKKQVTKTTSTMLNNTNIKSVLMGRSSCFGKCPSYTIEIFETGMMRFTGNSFTPLIGTYEKSVGSDKTVQLIKDFNATQPENLRNTYERRIADLPGIYYYITYPDSVKKVMNADAGPEYLREWAVKIDSFARVDNTWKKVAETTQKK